MKKMLIALLILIPLFSCNTFSQEDQIQPSLLSIGPYFAFKGGVNGGNVQLGRKNALSFYAVPDFGVAVHYALKDDYSVALSCNLGYSTYSYGLIGVDNDVNYNFHYGYISISPNIYFMYFNLGFTLGYPINADFGESINTNHLNPLAEFNLGAYYPIMYDEDMEMDVFINAGYMLAGVYKDYAKDDPLKNLVKAVPPDITTDLYNPRAITFAIGINYLFSIDTNK